MGTALRALAAAATLAVAVDRTRVIDVLREEVAKADSMWSAWKKLGASASKLEEAAKTRDIVRTVLRAAEADRLSDEEWQQLHHATAPGEGASS